jgi:hypothetical protein
MKNAGDIKLAVKQARKVYVFEKLRDGELNNAEAASMLEFSVRQIQRIEKAFDIEGYSAFQHGNTGRKPVHALSREIEKNWSLIELRFIVEQVVSIFPDF